MEQVAELLKLAPRYLAAVGLFSGILLFLPDRVLNRLGVADLTQNYRTWFGVAFLVAVSMLVIHWVIEFVNSYWQKSLREKSRKRTTERIVKHLQSLTEEEKEILRFYIWQKTRTNMLHVNDGVVWGLVSRGIICQASPIGDLTNGFAHNITDFAWEYLHENPDLLEGATNYMRTDRETT